MSQTTFLIVAGVSLALLAASGNIDGFRARPRMPQRVLSQAELQLFTTTRATGEIVMAGSSGVIIDQGFQAVRVGTDAITFLAGSTADTEVVRIGTNGNVGIGTTNSSTNKLTVQGAARLNGTSAALELNDGNSGLTYSSSTNAFVGTGTAAKPSNGPVLFGQTDGALGVKGGGQANALYWNSTGVGIKNNAPAYALDVTGSVHATSDAVFDSNVGIGNSAPAYKLDVTGGVHATSNAVFDSNVGIGNSAPAYKLDVTGGVHATSNAIFDSKVGIGTSAPGASYALDVTGGVHATSNAIFDSKVGIGNAAPGANYALDVTGNVNFTGSLYQGGSLFKTSQWTTTGSDIIYTAGKIGIGVTAPTAAIHVASGSDINLSNALVVKNTSTTTLAASASLGLTFASLNDNVTNGRTSYDPSYVLFTVDNTLPGPSTTWASTGAVPFAANSVFVVNITLSSTDSFPPGVTITTNDAAGDIGYDNTADFWSAGGTRATATAYTSTFTLAYPTNRVGIRVRGGYGRTVRVHAFSVSAQAATNASAVNVGVGTTAPTSNFQLATGSTFDLGTAKAQWTDTGITAATMKASGVTVNCAVTGPDANGYYTFTVPSGWTTGASFVYLPSSMVNGATYQVSITMRSSFATAPVIIVSDGTSKNYLSSTTLTGTATTYTSSAVASTSTQLQIYLVNPAANMSFQFKDLSVARLDTTLSGMVGIGTIAPVGKFHVYDATCSTQIYTNQPTSHPTFPNNAIVLEAQPNAGYSSVLIRSNHINVSDRYLLWVQCSQSPNYFYVRNDGYTYASWFAAGSKAFDIQHPLHADPAKRLVHLSVEGPRSDLLYRGSVRLVNGRAVVDLDRDSTEKPSSAMTPGTFAALCRHPVVFLQNNETFDRVVGSVEGSILTILCENPVSVSVQWMVIAERGDPEIRKAEMVDKEGYLVTEYTSTAPHKS